MIHLTPFERRPDGHGGNRRSYQLRQDLLDVVTPEQMAAIDRPLDFVPAAERRGLRHQVHRVRRLWRAMRGNPLKPLRPSSFTPYLFSSPAFLSHYESLVRASARPLVCLLEHPGFAAVASINARHGVRTIGCPQNLESLDTCVVPSGDGVGRRARALDFATELEVLGAWDERLLISRVEAGLVTGLGLGGMLYPYVPVGEVRSGLEQVRRLRAERRPERGLFVMLGTAGHETTRRALSWWLDGARAQGLPPGARVVVGGLQTEALGPAPAGVELRGWIEADVLDGLLARANGFLVPQTMGFGAVTRVADLACAGVPVLASEQVLWALDAPPGVRAVPNHWLTWRAQMERLMDESAAAPPSDYEQWAAAQPRPVGVTVRRLLQE